MKLRKLFAAGLALVMTLAMAAPTMAATITVDPAVKGQTYTAYKIFDVTKAEGSEGYSYTANQAMYDLLNGKVAGVTLTATSVAGKYNASMTNTEDTAKALAVFLNDNITSLTKAKEVKAADTKAVIDGLEPGYYFVDSSLGSLCILNTTTDTVTVKEKNQEPTIDKKISETSDGTYSVGDKIPYTVTVTAGGNAETSYVVTDTMSESLTFNDDIKIMVGSDDITANPNVTITKPATGDTFTFKITFAKDYVATLAQDTNLFRYPEREVCAGHWREQQGNPELWFRQQRRAER